MLELVKHPELSPVAPAAGSGLYVHVPFCRGKCSYCDFYSEDSCGGTDLWLDAVEKEMEFYRGRFCRLDTLYLGGGTPSLLPRASVQRLLDRARSVFSFSPDAEVTMEANPDDLDVPALRFLRSLDINRLSIGIQSLNDCELRLLGRRHTAAQARQALSRAREVFDNVSADLLFALPGQTLDAWSRTLREISEFSPEHVSCYQLTAKEGTVLARRLETGELSMPDEETQERFLRFTSRFLTDAGYIHYEVSNFCRQERFRCRHNLKYWRRVPYLGLGPSAHSFDGTRRWWNAASLDSYCESVRSGRRPVAGEEELTEEQAWIESLWLGLRTREGVEEALVHGRPSGSKALAELQRTGRAVVREGRILPTREGFLFADGIPRLFF